jgi:PAS domain S-box-containing protein
MTKDGGFSYVNDMACTSLGYRRDELLKLKLWNIDPQYSKSQWHENWEKYQINRQGGEELIETIHKRKDGTEFPVEVSSKHIWFGEQELHVTFVRDISDRKNYEREIIEAKDKAESSEKLKSEFLAQMSHEIRSPIYIILSYVDIIRESVSNKIDKELLPSFESIKLAGDRIIRTIDLILNMSDLQLGTYEVTYKNFALSSLLKSLIREYLQPATDKNIKIEFEDEAQSSKLVSDEYAVSQIFANLIDNAVKYTQEGTITVKIFNDEASGIITQISDTGIGISEEYIPVLFSPFSQEEQGYTRKYDGNGLGLSLVKKYCDLLGAEISVESKKNKGATFTVKFNISQN